MAVAPFRSLILAGGGLKIAYQAGALQVLLDEAGMRFDHVDAASGGCFNAAMMASGMSGTQIADQWRTMHPRDFATFAFGDLKRKWVLWARALGTDDGLKHIFEHVWKLDFEAINAEQPTVFTFNHYNFTQKRVVVVENRKLDLDTLLASVTLLMWLPRIKIGADFLFDAAYLTDGNVSEAIRRGAEEIWAIWTLSDTPEMRDGFFAHYFHIIQAIGNARFREEWAEIAAVNEALRTTPPCDCRKTPDLRLQSDFNRGKPAILPPPGRHKIVQHLIRQEVAVHETLIFSRDRVAAAVELGVRDTRAYLRALPRLVNLNITQAHVEPDRPPALRFNETMRGFFMPGVMSVMQGARDGYMNGNALAVHLTIDALDLDTFLHQPEHRATVTGFVAAPLLSGHAMPIYNGTFGCLISDRDLNGRVAPKNKTMHYDLNFNDAGGTAYRLKGRKIVRPGSLRDAWPDTSTLYFKLFRRLPGAAPETDLGSGIVQIRPLDFVRELASFRAPSACNVLDAAGAIGRFAEFFAGQLCDVYLRDVIDYAPF